MPADRDAAASTGDWALVLGAKVVSVYDSYQDAEDARTWYVETYGQPSVPLRVEECEPDA